MMVETVFLAMGDCSPKGQIKVDETSCCTSGPMLQTSLEDNPIQPTREEQAVLSSAA